MIGILLLLNTAKAELGAQLSVEQSTPLDSLSEILEPGIENNLKLYWNQSDLDVGLLISSGHYNGLYYEAQADLGCAQAGTCMQGDSWIGGLGVFGAYHVQLPFASVGPYIGLQANTIPLFMDEEYYKSEVVSSWGGTKSQIHDFVFIPSARAGADVRFPIFDGDCGFLLTGGAHYMLSVDLFYHVGIGFYLN